MKTLCIVLALLGQFPVEELKPSIPSQPEVALIFIQEELPQPKQVASKPHFEFLSAPWCGGCQSIKEALERLDKETLPFTYSVANVDSRGWLGASSIPAWAYNGKVIQYGFSTPENLMKNFRNATQPKQARSVNTVQRFSASELKTFAHSYQGGSVGVKGGDFYSHLQSGNHGFSTNQLNGLSQSECERIHSAHHNGHITPFKSGN